MLYDKTLIGQVVDTTVLFYDAVSAGLAERDIICAGFIGMYRSGRHTLCHLQTSENVSSVIVYFYDIALL